VRDLPWVALDLEMTGLDDEHDRICEIGLVWGRDGAAGGEWSTLVDPGVPMPADARAVHGLDAAALRGAPRFADVVDAVLPRLEGALVLAHNAAVDVAFLARASARAGRTLPAMHVVDTLTMARRTLALRRHRLMDVGAVLGLAPSRTHRALDDARTTFGVFSRLLDLLDGGRALTVNGLEHRLHDLGRTSEVRHAARKAIASALAARRTVRLTYVSRDDQGHAVLTAREVDVWRVKGSKFEGWCRLRGEARVFRLDRLLDVEATEVGYAIPAHVSRL
jgi:DNA polymerase III epsilon subunit family exonuclease